MLCFGERKRRRSLAFFVTYLTCNQLLQCRRDRFVYWLIQRDDEHNNRTYCTVQCIFELSCVMLKWLKDKPAVSYPLCVVFFLLLSIQQSFLKADITEHKGRTFQNGSLLQCQQTVLHLRCLFLRPPHRGLLTLLGGDKDQSKQLKE